MEIFLPVVLNEATKLLKRKADLLGMGQNVEVKLDRNLVKVTAKYRGTSTFTFKPKEVEGGISLELITKDVSFFHKPFIDTALCKLKSSIENPS